MAANKVTAVHRGYAISEPATSEPRGHGTGGSFRFWWRLGVKAAFDVHADQIEITLDQFGTANEIALHLLTGLAGQEIALRFGFHPFRDDRNLQGMRETQDRADDLGRLPPGWR